MGKDYFDLSAMRTGRSKSDLAAAYFPNISDDATARRNLRRWIALNPELTKRLQQAGYRPRQRYFTPKQVDAIFDILGEP